MDSKTGLYLVITDDTELTSTLVHIQPKGMDVKVWCPPKPSQLASDLVAAVKTSDEVEDILVKGELNQGRFFSQWKSYDPICVVLSLKEPEKHKQIRDGIIKYLPEARILSLQMGHPDEMPRSLEQNERELVLSWAELLIRPVSAELRHIQSTHHVNAIRKVLDSGDKIAFLLQPDPDPDGLASALALRNVLGRNKVSTPIVSYGRVTRPENIAMMRLLDIDVTKIRPDDLASFDRVVLLDTQPSHLGNLPIRVDAIVDHHPIKRDYSDVPYVDIRPAYGATSTILTEYLRAAACNISERLATALLYGIKADTLHLNREVIDADLDAFVSLYPNINYNLLRRIEKPELPMRFAPVLAHALETMATESGVLVTCLGEVQREDLIPQVADFLLQFEGMEWVVCAGVFEDNVVMSVRNVGYVKNAGDVVKRIIDGWGLGGGHRTMAKAIIPVSAWKLRHGSTAPNVIRDVVLGLFLEEAL